MDPVRFEVTENHLKLLERFWFDYNDWTEFGAPEVDPKRPYGNSDVYGDLGEILEIEPEVEDSWGDRYYSKSQKEELLAIHKEMTTVLNILTNVAREGVQPGWYVKETPYGNNWKREN